MAEDLIAHVKQNSDDTWDIPQSLMEHLKNTAEYAANFADKFNSGPWGYSLGIAHDAGKSCKAWQDYLKKKSGYDENAHLENTPGKMDHSTPGAKMVEELLGKGVGRVLSYCISGHHAGLPDWSGSQSSLDFRLRKSVTEGIADEILSYVIEADPKTLPWLFDNIGLDLSLWIRMLFSCLVDADFLDTEEYMSPERTLERGGYLTIKELQTRLNRYVKELTNAAPDTEVNRVRRDVLSDCQKAAVLPPGFFSLTVPTGGGKTISSMDFALRHAVTYNKDRVIYVIPYTSIIEQNADVFRNALGPDQVIEHHSNLDDEDSTAKTRLAAENWDVPVVVTTSVQFFESLFAAKTSRCRKLHNICNSVVVLDEAQLLSVEFLAPILRTMELLVNHYRVTFIICTATQPAIEQRDDSPKFPGIKKGSIREIIQNVPALYHSLKRVNVEIPNDLKTTCSWEELADNLTTHNCVLCIVSDRKSCRTLYHLMPKGTYHLSALMCAQHRSEIITRIKTDLNEDKPVRVISTQLVEAGVDLDFPVVYRAIAGLDSIAQAAGRCNREGRLNEEGNFGKVVLFIPPKLPPPGNLRKAAETTLRMLDNGVTDPIDQKVFPPFFSEIYWKANSLDKNGILDLLQPEPSELGIQFRSAGKAFHIIDETKHSSILVPYGEGVHWIKQLKDKGPERWLLRKLQRYSVNIYTADFNDFLKRGSLQEISPGIFILVSEVEYDNNTGLVMNEEIFNPEKYMM
ncbi:MAG: CRISPR-associated endonuclease Cas3'' [Spirochaetales bacterium]|nr:CRISPR-associated endonuclease Cas3'' [Spirochaetales bacterium]